MYVLSFCTLLILSCFIFVLSCILDVYRDEILEYFKSRKKIKYIKLNCENDFSNSNR